MRKIVCLGLVLLAGVLFAVPAWADEEVEAVESGESSTEYTGVREKSFGARLAFYPSLGGGADFLWRPKWGLGVLQVENVNYSDDFNGDRLRFSGANVNFGIGIWTNMQKTNWWGGHVYFGLALPVVSGEGPEYSSRVSMGQGKFAGLGVDIYPRLWRGGRMEKGDKLSSYFVDVKAVSRRVILKFNNGKSGTYSSSLWENVMVEVGARYWF